MATNVMNEHTNVWTVTATEALSLVSSLSRPVVGEVIYFPSAVGDNLVFQDGDQSEDAIVLKAGASDTSPVHKSFRPQGKRVVNLTCSTIDGGTAYVYFI